MDMAAWTETHIFQSTLLMRGATLTVVVAVGITKRISIHAPHARSDDAGGDSGLCQGISIHAPHARSDSKSFRSSSVRSISIHTPHARSDLCRISESIQWLYFNPRSSCEERPHCTRFVSSGKNFNPRSSCEERLISIQVHHATPIFQSTLLMRGATPFAGNGVDVMRISIHAPHARSDDDVLQVLRDDGISIHAPHARSDLTARGERRIQSISIHAPHARSDEAMKEGALDVVISIHAPHARSDASRQSFHAASCHFNPRSSCEERLRMLDSSSTTPLFQSTLLMRGATS